MKQFMPLILLALLCLFMAVGIMKGNKKEAAVSPMVGRQFPTMVLGGDNVNQILGHKVMVINLFASWCAPCAVEAPVLMKIAQRNLAPIMGIAWKNTPDDAMKFLGQYGNPYRDIVFDQAGGSTVPLGVSGVPETFIVDRNGTIYYHATQPLSDEMLENEIAPLLEKLQAE